MQYSLYGKSMPIYDAKSNLDYLKAQAQHPWTHSQTDHRGILLTPRTDMDHFPYRRFYRGNHRSTDPSVYSRQAGYAPRVDELYVTAKASEQCHPYLNLKNDLLFSKPYKNTKFETSCTQVYPSFQPDSEYPHTLMGYSNHIPIASIMNR